MIDLDRGEKMEQREFLKIIKGCRRRMNLADFAAKSFLALSIGAGAGILIQAVAFWVPLYYAGLYALLALLLAELPVLVVMVFRQTTMEQAALRIDCFGFEERVVTAYEHLDKEGMLMELQRADAMRQLKAHKDRIHIRLWPSRQRTVLLLLMLVFSWGLSLVPSAAKDRAGELHSLKEEAREKEKEIEQIIDTLEQLKQEEWTTDQQEALLEMKESLESSLSEFGQAYSEEMLKAANQKLNYKYENMSGQLSDLIQELQDGAEASVASADSIKEMTDLLKKMDGRKPGQGNGNDSQTAQGGMGGDGQEGNEGSAGNGQCGQNGQNGQSGQNGQNGQGDSPGNGRGTGSSSSPHDYVSVPNAIADSGNLTGNAAGHDTSEFFRAQNGLNWEGEHMSYEAVIGSYEQNAYEGIAADKYPSGMEDIIKEYFSSFN